MTSKSLPLDPNRYNPQFQWGFLTPKYWLTWLGIFIGVLLSFLPHSIKRTLAKCIAKKVCQKKRGTIHNAWVNLSLCFPHKSHAEKEALLLQSVTTAITYLLGFAALTARSQKWLNQHTEIEGIEHIESALAQNDNIILLVPHTWCVDIPAILLASKGLPVTGFMKSQRNELSDWLMHRQRVQYGGQLFDREKGIKPFIKAIRNGYMGYYLGDQDHGRTNSVFVNFFNTKKATLSGIGKLSKLSRAKVIPLFPLYNTQTGHYKVEIQPAWQDFPCVTEELDAQKMNDYIEQKIAEHPEQYMWNFRFFRTQSDSESHYNPYKDPCYQYDKKDSK